MPGGYSRQVKISPNRFPIRKLDIFRNQTYSPLKSRMYSNQSARGTKLNKLEAIYEQSQTPNLERNVFGMRGALGIRA